MNVPEVFGVVEVLEVVEPNKDGGWEDQSVKILSEEPVSFEKPVVLVEEWKDSTSSGEVEDGKPK